MKIVYGIVFCALIVSPALADEVRKIDFTTSLTTFQGKPFSLCLQQSEDGKLCVSSAKTIGEISAVALTMPERNLSLLETIKRGKLADRLYAAKSDSLTAPDATLVMDQIAKMGLPTVVAFHVAEAIDPASAK